MQCPHCKTNLKYRERSGSVCSSCKREFAFEPKTHSLRLNDVRFRKVVEKLSDNGKLFYTPDQLAYFLARKKLPVKTPPWVLLIVGFIAAVITVVVSKSFNFAGVVFGGFAVWAICLWLFRSSNTVPPHTGQFVGDVLQRWIMVYKERPTNLIESFELNPALPNNFRGFLVCSERDVSLCLAANKTLENLGLALLPTDKSFKQFWANLNIPAKDLPIFILHDASPAGYDFLARKTTELKNSFDQPQIFDIGLRPQTAIKNKMQLFRETNVDKVFIEQIKNLSAEEKNWLKEGNYACLLSLTPAQLIRYVTNTVVKTAKQNKSVEAKFEAQAVGFMTWMNE